MDYTESNIAANNICKGVTTNAVQIGEELLWRGLL